MKLNKFLNERDPNQSYAIDKDWEENVAPLIQDGWKVFSSGKSNMPKITRYFNEPATIDRDEHNLVILKKGDKTMVVAYVTSDSHIINKISRFIKNLFNME